MYVFFPCSWVCVFVKVGSLLTWPHTQFEYIFLSKKSDVCACRYLILVYNMFHIVLLQLDLWGWSDSDFGQTNLLLLNDGLHWSLFLTSPPYPTTLNTRSILFSFFQATKILSVVSLLLIWIYLFLIQCCVRWGRYTL